MNLIKQIRWFLGRIKYNLKKKYNNEVFQKRVAENGGFAGKPLALLNSTYIKIGKHIKIKDQYRIECYDLFYNQRLDPNFIIHDGVIIGYGFTSFVADRIEIGRETILAGNVTLISENHGMNPEIGTPYHAQPLTHGPITIGEGCWIGQNVSILPNVKIGKKCIIATNSVVNSNIPDFSIAAGIPAKVIKRYDFTNHKWVRIKLEKI